MCILFVVFHLSGLAGGVVGCAVGLARNAPSAAVGLVVGLIGGYIVGLVGAVALGILLELISIGAGYALEKTAQRPEPLWATAAALALFPLVVVCLTILSLSVIAGAGHLSYRVASWLTSQ